MGRITFRAAALLVLVCFVFTPAKTSAADKPSGPKDQKGKMTFKHARVVTAPGQQGRSVVAEALRAFDADRKAGKFATLAEEKRARRETLQRAFERNRSDAGLTARATATGAQILDLEGRFEHVWLSRTNPDGSISTACVTDWASAEAFLDGAASSSRETE